MSSTMQDYLDRDDDPETYPPGLAGPSAAAQRFLVPSMRTQGGRIGSGDEVMRSTEEGITLAQEYGGVDCFGMEAAGLVEGDHGDSHQSDDMQGVEPLNAGGVVCARLEDMSGVERPRGLPRRTAEAGAVRQQRLRVNRKSDWPLLTNKVHCYLCGLGHLLPECDAGPKTIRAERNRRMAQGRCLACGVADHWYRDCRYKHLVEE
ncbi:uncharacterized protein B0I36DRAFT_313312 [Microdochium trichocladiopsis]|uniref:CCHC-type domain-containing protein n=1 Tax=Microdochium trichocladiopsis TaxID=1682393 RepID=A0A9P8YFQ4_9PEZI|nr:uncharacterized protein B0I36DRAFT_313312 [Microdochium trichocladiopsis]KAH7037088.1 hypothetical protein B0I36DRAFT_313312 [Microdochium trichocladiopsis]